MMYGGGKHFHPAVSMFMQPFFVVSCFTVDRCVTLVLQALSCVSVAVNLIEA